ncbi:MAG: cold shock domain-containing protein [Planctomycetota bacterium]
MPEKESNDDDQPPKRFRIARKRLGKVRFVDEKGEYGFIEAEDFRDDVFFHHSSFEGEMPKPGSGPLSQRPDSRGGRKPDGKPPAGRDRRYGKPPEIAPGKLSLELVQRTVEFEIDDDLFETEQRLRARVVRLSKRPMGRKLSGRDATFNIVTHHPKARRKRPDWRK